MQNLAPGAPAVPHLGQAAGRSDAPHSLQNFAPAGTGALHFGHGLAAGAAGCGAAGAWPGCSDGVSALPITAPRLMPTPRPTPAPARPPLPDFAASSSASAALKRV